jgi:hypothetical protein
MQVLTLVLVAEEAGTAVAEMATVVLVAAPDTLAELKNGEAISGDQSMPNPNGGTMVGKTGHGYARITYVGN